MNYRLEMKCRNHEDAVRQYTELVNMLTDGNRDNLTGSSWCIFVKENTVRAEFDSTLIIPNVYPLYNLSQEVNMITEGAQNYEIRITTLDTNNNLSSFDMCDAIITNFIGIEDYKNGKIKIDFDKETGEIVIKFSATTLWRPVVLFDYLRLDEQASVEPEDDDSDTVG